MNTYAAGQSRGSDCRPWLPDPAKAEAGVAAEGVNWVPQMRSSGRLEGSQRVRSRTENRAKGMEGAGLRVSVFSKTGSPDPFLLGAWQDLEPGQRLLKVLG